MEILNFESSALNQKKNNFLPEVVNSIFAICKNDPNFPLKNQINDIEESLDSLRLKIDKQNDLLNQSEKLKKDLVKRITMLEGDNSSLQEELLESLGSEL